MYEIRLFAKILPVCNKRCVLVIGVKLFFSNKSNFISWALKRMFDLQTYSYKEGFIVFKYKTLGTTISKRCFILKLFLLWSSLPPERIGAPLSSSVSSTLSPLSSPVTRSTLHIRSRRRCCLPASLVVFSRSREPWLREGALLHASQARPLHSASPFPLSPQLRILWALIEVCRGGWDR